MSWLSMTFSLYYLYTATIFRLVFALRWGRFYFSDEGEKDDSSDESSSSDEEEEATENDGGRNESKKTPNQNSEGDDDVPMKITNNKNKSFASGKLLKYAFFANQIIWDLNFFLKSFIFYS